MAKPSCICCGLLAFACALWLGAGRADGADDASQECLACHSDPIDITLQDRTTRALTVHATDLAQSVHAGVSCVDCHPAASEVPHPERTFASSRQFSVAMSEQCRQCHFQEYRKSLDSVHAAAVARGDTTAPVCIDCHGSHAVKKPNQPRTRVAEACGRCHTATAATFAQSVHGRDIASNSADVPTCTNCHGGHQIAGPGQPGWRSSTPEICGSCHSDPARMKKYGLSTDVLHTYFADFHGKTASLRGSRTSSALVGNRTPSVLGSRRPSGLRDEQVVAVCSDCHGTHGVARVTSAASPAMRANVLDTCRRCHEDAAAGFSDAWLSHYEPDWKRTPAIMAVKTGYAILIPFMIGGMGLQILLHLWRMAVNR
jgi:predicted CXXCH cytochrome family protein